MIRSEAEERDFAMACKVIEDQGGDVLEYIKVNYPSYTPRPVWYRLQRTFLNRHSVDQLTEGRPRETKEGDGKKVPREKRDMKAVVTGLMMTMKEGGSPQKYLTDQGYTNIYSALRNIKMWTKEKMPEAYPEVSNIHLGRPVTEKPKISDSTPVQEPTTADTPNEPEAEEAGTMAIELTLPDQVVQVKMKVIEVETDLGNFRKEDGKIAFRRADDGKDYKNQLKMTVPQWRQLMEELDEVLKMLEEIDY